MNWPEPKIASPSNASATTIQFRPTTPSSSNFRTAFSPDGPASSATTIISRRPLRPGKFPKWPFPTRPQPSPKLIQKALRGFNPAALHCPKNRCHPEAQRGICFLRSAKENAARAKDDLLFFRTCGRAQLAGMCEESYFLSGVTEAAGALGAGVAAAPGVGSFPATGPIVRLRSLEDPQSSGGNAILQNSGDGSMNSNPTSARP